MDRRVRRLRAILLTLTLPLADAASQLIRKKDWRTFGYSSLDDHARERFGRSGRWVRDLAALGRALRRIPRLGLALTGEDGGPPIGTVAARLIDRVAMPTTVEAWIKMARQVTTRALRREIQRSAAAMRSHPLPPAQDDESGASGECSAPGEPGGTGEPKATGASGAPGEPSPNRSASTAGDVLATEPEEPASRWITLDVPPPVRIAFEEARDLYSAIEGRGVGTGEFIEALVAEATSGSLAQNLPDPPAGKPRPAVRATAEDRSPADTKPPLNDEAHLRAQVRLWLRGVLNEFDDLGRCHPTPPDRCMRLLLDLQEDVERKLAEVMSELAHERAWQLLGYSGFTEYAERCIGWRSSTAHERVWLVRHLRLLPVVKDAYEDGRIGYAATLTLVRGLKRAQEEQRGVPLASIPASVQTQWVQRAHAATVKRLRDETQSRAQMQAFASQPSNGREPEGGAAKSSAEGAAEPPAGGMTESPGQGAEEHSTRLGPPVPLTDAQWHASLHRQVGDAVIRVKSLMISALEWRARLQPLRLRLENELARDFLAAVHVASRSAAGRSVVQMTAGRAVVQTTAGRSVVQTTAGRAVVQTTAGRSVVQTTAGRAFSTDAGWVGLLALIHEFVSTWDSDPVERRPSRTRVYARDGWRCMAPGCTSRRQLERHHVIYRSHQGSDDDENLVCLCYMHHQEGEHGYFSEVTGVAPLGLDWRLGKKGCGGRFRNEMTRRHGGSV